MLLFSVLVQDSSASLCYLPLGQNYKSSLDGQSTFSDDDDDADADADADADNNKKLADKMLHPNHENVINFATELHFC